MVGVRMIKLAQALGTHLYMAVAEARGGYIPASSLSRLTGLPNRTSCLRSDFP